ncbi:RNA-dependent RNA polymerase [Lasius neglectus virus 1]|uniref:RNA-dependent RNA polymerase n=1 Tax=Lasius neglectus virus 1 TaxID=2018501 RepID=A0A220QTG2_9VIRU|nr:RNA-dependent RNA polymerase [Lasius neglectus virus 1]ASK12200.1 RNA-dependent RNA polymerase [Lasius neglectus virus 1]
MNMQSTTNQTKQNNQGRKKFGVSSRIINDLRRVIKTSSVWVHYTPSSLLKTFEYDATRKFLPVRGNRVIKFDYSNLDVLSLLKTFETEVHEPFHGKRLAHSPIYSAPSVEIDPAKELGYENEFPYFTSNSTDHDTCFDKFVELNKKYQSLNHFNIDEEFRYSSMDTFMLCLTESLKILESNSPHKLNHLLFDHLNRYKFSRIDNYGIYMFILHLKIRGIAKIDNLTSISKWKNAWSMRTLPERQELLTNFYQGKLTTNFAAFQQSYISELVSRLSIISHEAKLVRYPDRIGRRAFDPEFVHYATWKYGLYDQMSVTERYRDSKGMPISHLLFGTPTMFKSGATDIVSDAINKNMPEFKDTIASVVDAKLKEAPNMLKKTIQDTLSDPDTITTIRDTITNVMQPTIDQFSQQAHDLSESTIRNIESTIGPVMDQTFNLFTSLNGLIDFFKSIINQAMGAFPSEYFGEKLGLNISPDDMLSMFKYYIVYVNIDSKPLKAILIYLMLKQIGLLSWILKWGSQLFSFAFGGKGPEVPLDGSEIPGEPTSGMEWMSVLIEKLQNRGSEVSLCSMFAALIVLVYKHVSCAKDAGTMRWNEYNTIAGFVVGMCKNFHWIGSGLFGLDRIFRYFVIISKTVTSYIKEHLLGIKEESITNEKAVAKWLVQLKFFSTDTGRNAIRVSKKTLERAERIMAEGLAFVTAASKDPTFISRDTLMLIHRSWKDVTTLSNYLYRIRSTSNFKPAMFHVQFVGEPGIGKSTITESFINDLSERIYPEDKEVSHWTYNPNVDHFDGYNGQTFMIIDDLFRYNEPKHLSLIIGLITNTPVPLPMAHLEDKGVHLDSDILISSTNIPYPIGKDIFCMEAVHRRRHILVDVQMDQRVKKDGKFSKQLFEKYYPGQNSLDFPHLKFSLMKPVMSGADSDKYQTTDKDTMEWQYDLVKKLKKANSSLKFDPEFFFGPDARPPDGLKVPCTNWSYKTFIENVAVAYSHLRAGENKMTAKQKYEHVMEDFAEIDNIFLQSDDIKDGVAASTTFKLIADKFLDMSLQYGADDPLGQRIYYQSDSLNDIAPDLFNLDVEEEVNRIMDDSEQKPTCDDGESSYEESVYDDSIEDQILTSDDGRIVLIQKYLQEKVDITPELRERMTLLMHKIIMRQTLDSDDEYTMGIAKGNVEAKVLPPYQARDEKQRSEMSRREAILHKHRKQVRDPHYDNMVRVVAKDEKKFIPIRSFYTEWSGYSSNSHPGEKFEYFPDANEKMTTHLIARFGGKTIEPVKARKMIEFVKRLNSGHKFVFPKRSPYSEAHQNQGSSHISLEFLSRLNYVNGEWSMDVSDLDWVVHDTCKFVEQINDVVKEYYVPFDVAFVLGMTQAFKYTANIFSLLSVSEQSDMVESAKWMFTHLYDCNLTNIRERIRTIAVQARRTVLSHVFHTASKIWEVLKPFIPVIIRVATFLGSFYITRQLIKLLNGVEQPTSKVLHRHNVQVGMRYRGIPQNGIFSKIDTQQQVAQNYLNRNIKFFHMTDSEGITYTAHGIHTQQFLIINAHTADNIKGPTMIQYRPTFNTNVEWEIEIWPNQVYKYPNNDLAIIFSRHLPMAKDITSHFITNEDFKTCETTTELWSLTNFQHQQSVEIRDNCIPAEKITLSAPDGRRGEIAMAIMVEGATIAGKSGSMLMIPSRKPGHRSIVGIQAWKVNDFYKKTIIYQVVTQEMLQDMITQVQKQVNRPVISQEGPLVCEPTAGKATELFTSHVNVEGSVPADKVVGMIGRTQFRKTKIASIMDSEAYTSPRVPAALNPYDSRLLIYKHPMQHSINKYGTGKVGSFDLAILERATQDLAYWLRERLDKTKFNTNLTLEECVTGIREPGSNPVDCRASAGLPYIWDKFPGKLAGKKSYVQIDELGECQVQSEEFRKNFEITFEKLSRGVIPKHTSYDFPKDELRPYYKALGDPISQTPPKTRSVTCMNMEFIFSWRRVTLDLFASLHRAARGDFPFGPGINPEGPDWTRLFNYLNRHNNVLDFDVSNWDGHMPPELMYAAADILVIVLGLKPNDPSAKVIYSLLTEVLFGHVQFEDTIYQKLRGLISGFPGTAEVNTLVHLILMYYFYLYIAQIQDKNQYANITDFFKLVSPVFYGDDVIMSVSDEIIDWFNGKTIACMYTEHGYPVTTASKDTDMPLRKDIFDCQFLKSGFNFIHPGRVDRKMDISVVYDLMYWVRAKEHPYDQFRSNLYDAFRILHGHGHDTYEQVRVQVNSWLRKAHLEPFDYRWGNFEDNHIKLYYSD